MPLFVPAEDPSIEKPIEKPPTSDSHSFDSHTTNQGVPTRSSTSPFFTLIQASRTSTLASSSSSTSIATSTSSTSTSSSSIVTTSTHTTRTSIVELPPPTIFETKTVTSSPSVSSDAGTSQNNTSGSGRTGHGNVAGGVVGALILLTVLATVGYLCYQRWKKSKEETEFDGVFDPDRVEKAHSPHHNVSDPSFSVTHGHRSTNLTLPIAPRPLSSQSTTPLRSHTPVPYTPTSPNFAPYSPQTPYPYTSWVPFPDTSQPPRSPSSYYEFPDSEIYLHANANSNINHHGSVHLQSPSFSDPRSSAYGQPPLPHSPSHLPITERSATPSPSPFDTPLAPGGTSSSPSIPRALLQSPFDPTSTPRATSPSPLRRSNSNSSLPYDNPEYAPQPRPSTPTERFTQISLTSSTDGFLTPRSS
ncbi:hypothetical protein L218DRAFT_965747 [Marasmius fiardii PR-910]|nr:hypothetical protein L218DRAFT_965747 [Marasmius fiardii PR-910]